MNARKGILILAGAMCIAWSVIDLSLWFWLEATNIDPRAQKTFRSAYRLEEVSRQDIVIVGDSFVWGQGVKKDEVFGAVLEALLRKDGVNAKVFNLGIPGIGLKEYISIAKMLPPRVVARNIIIALYMNDFPDIPTLETQAFRVLGNLGNSSLGFRFLEDKFKILRTRSMEEHFRQIVRSYDEKSVYSEEKWSIFKGYLKEFERVSRRHSSNQPVLLIIPIMVSFKDYPLRNAHARIARMAENLGFAAVDLLPLFEEKLGDGRLYLAAPNDSHFNPYVHEIVGRYLKGKIPLLLPGVLSDSR